MKAPAKLVCLESYWNEKLFQTHTVKGFFEAMAPLAHPPITVAHRFVDSQASLVCDLLFLHRFYADPAPWKNLRRIFASVQRDYPPARRMGHTLVMRD